MKVIILILLTGLSSYFLTFIQNKEIFKSPDGKVTVHFVKWPLNDPKIELRGMNGLLLATKNVGDVEVDDIEIHLTDQGIVVLPGDSDWLWKDELWK